MTSRTTLFDVRSIAFTRLGIDVTGQTVLTEFLNGWMARTYWVERTQGCNSCSRFFIGHSADPKTGSQIRCAPNVKRMLAIAPAYVDWTLVITRWI
jgi:hypothetical protein